MKLEQRCALGDGYAHSKNKKKLTKCMHFIEERDRDDDLVVCEYAVIKNARTYCEHAMFGDTDSLEFVLERAIVRCIAKNPETIAEKVLPLFKLKPASELYQLIASLDTVSAFTLCYIGGKDFRDAWKRAAQAKTKSSKTKIAHETWHRTVNRLFKYLI
jgi:hypothetical protein